MSRSSTLTLSIADAQDRLSIYAARHLVYASKLGQHPETPDGVLTDILDEVNTYLVAKRDDQVVGFVAITPPNRRGYSVDKYFAREDMPFRGDEDLYEVRLLTVVKSSRRTRLAALLMYAALRYVESHGARVVVAIGRQEVLRLYERTGLRSHGLRARAGAVTYELMSAGVRELRAHLDQFGSVLRRFERSVDWRVAGVPFRPEDRCFHGGALWDTIGDTFQTLERRQDVVDADVLDAWFDPAPRVVRALQQSLPFVLKTSPPTGGEGMRRVIARTRGVPEDSILPGAGSSDLIFAALRGWVTSAARVLILDPMYAEYAHVLERVIGANVDRLMLSRADDYQLDPRQLANALARGYDWVVLVNPNSPTGRHLLRQQLEQLMSEAPKTTRFWIDETYVDYAGEGQSLEAYAAARPRWSSSSRCQRHMPCLVCGLRICAVPPLSFWRLYAGAPRGRSVCPGKSQPVRRWPAPTTTAAAGRKLQDFVTSSRPDSRHRVGMSCLAAPTSCCVTCLGRPRTRPSRSPCFGRRDSSSGMRRAWAGPWAGAPSGSPSRTGRRTSESWPRSQPRSVGSRNRRAPRLA